MHPETRTQFTIATFAVMLLAGCGSTERVSVTVTYEAQLKSGDWGVPSPGQIIVEEAFKRYATQHGYACRADFKDAKNTTCRGPKDLHFEFQPSLNRPEFVATFGWVNSSDRTHDEFVLLVSEFKTYMSSVVGSQNVQVAN